MPLNLLRMDSDHELVIRLPLPSWFWNYMCEHLTSAVLGTEYWALCVPGKHSTHEGAFPGKYKVSLYGNSRVVVAHTINPSRGRRISMSSRPGLKSEFQHSQGYTDKHVSEGKKGVRGDTKAPCTH